MTAWPQGYGAAARRKAQNFGPLSSAPSGGEGWERRFMESLHDVRIAQWGHEPVRIADLQSAAATMVERAADCKSALRLPRKSIASGWKSIQALLCEVMAQWARGFMGRDPVVRPASSRNVGGARN